MGKCLSRLLVIRSTETHLNTSCKQGHNDISIDVRLAFTLKNSGKVEHWNGKLRLTSIKKKIPVQDVVL